MCFGGRFCDHEFLESVPQGSGFPHWEAAEGGCFVSLQFSEGLADLLPWWVEPVFAVAPVYLPGVPLNRPIYPP